MSYQRIISKSPCRTQSHSSAMFHPDHHKQIVNFQQRSQYQSGSDELQQLKQRCFDQQKIIENQHFQMNEMKQFISDCQISLCHFKQQLEYQQSLQEQHNNELQELQELVKNLKDENQELTLLYNQKQKEVEDMKNNNKSFENKQMDSGLKAKIENDIKEIHNKYLREIQLLKVKIHDQDQHQQVISQLQEKCEELLQGIETKNNYIDNLLLQLSDLDEKYENLKKKTKH